MSWVGWVLCAYIAGVSIPLAVVDIRKHRLPNKLVVPGIALALLCGILELVISNGRNWTPLLCCGVYFGLMLVLGLLGGLGMGDVKLAAVLGAAAGFMGADAVVASIVAAFMLGGAVASVLWLSKRRGRIPFGPFMLAGYWAAMVAGLAAAWSSAF
jgi:leader peptidase (prepilin peptidase)/N-methyltransferase